MMPNPNFNKILDDALIKQIQFTNADRIRAMTDEELAQWLENIDTAFEPETIVSQRGWLYWLKQGVKGDK